MSIRRSRSRGKSVARGLAPSIALKIIERIRSDSLPAGAHLGEHPLALQFHVSRSPVHAALEILTAQGVVELRRNRGHFLVADANKLDRVAAMIGQHGDEEAYLRLAADRLAHRLPAQFTETELMHHYGVGRAQLRGMLVRMAREGWVERKPGYGWKFLPILTSSAAHAQSYRFRMAIEPAAILEPTFRVNARAFARLRAEQQDLVDGRIGRLSSTELFEIGSRFHETVIGCSGNPLFSEALRRIDRLRRIIEYRAMADTERFMQQAREHLRLLDLLEAGERERAAELMRRHLEVVREVKSTVLNRRHQLASGERAAATAGGSAMRHAHF